MTQDNEKKYKDIIRDCLRQVQSNQSILKSYNTTSALMKSLQAERINADAEQSYIENAQKRKFCL